MTIGKKLMLSTAAVFASAVLYSAPAYAQATRTWVSGVGDDANPCSRTAPCRTFAGAISKTAGGGEINCLDPGGFGGVTVTKAITFICDTTLGGVLVAGTNSFTINAADADIVTISGIDMFGPTATPGLNGVRFVNGAGLNIRNSTIKGFSSQGVSFEVGPGDTSFLNLDNVTIIGNGTVGDPTTGAIKVTAGIGGTANVQISNVRASNNQNAGLRIDLSATTGTRVNAVVSNSQFLNDGAGFLFKAPAGTGTIGALVTGSVTSQNATSGITANGTGVNANFGTTTITYNTVGINILNAGVVNSFGTNLLLNNPAVGAPANGAFTATIPPM
jgi:hypothetical protein